MSFVIEDAPISIQILNYAVPSVDFPKDKKKFSPIVLLDLSNESLEAEAFQKRRDWQVRKSLIPMEVIRAAGIEDQKLIDFLMGIAKTDPQPNKLINFPELVRSSEVIPDEELDEFSPSIPDRKWIIREKGSLRHELKEAMLGRPLPSLTEEQIGAFNKLSAFSSAILLALATASGDLETSERLSMEGKFDFGKPAIDYHPSRKPIYHRLKAVTDLIESPVFES